MDGQHGHRVKDHDEDHALFAMKPSMLYPSSIRRHLSLLQSSISPSVHDQDRPEIFSINFNLHMALMFFIGLFHVIVCVAVAEHTIFAFIFSCVYMTFLYMRCVLHKMADAARAQRHDEHTAQPVDEAGGASAANCAEAGVVLFRVTRWRRLGSKACSEA